MKQLILSSLIMLTVTGCAVHLPEDELSSARSKLDYYLQNCAMTQQEMNLISSYMLQLANMEKYMIEYRIWNQSNYGQIEKEFMKDCEQWEKQAEKEAEKASEFEGGSMAPMDHNLRMSDFIEKRIKELKAKWQLK